MKKSNLHEIYNQLRLIPKGQCPLGYSKDDSLTFKLSCRIAYACENQEDFVAAVTAHNYPPIILTKNEAEFLKAGGLPRGLAANHSYIKSLN